MEEEKKLVFCSSEFMGIFVQTHVIAKQRKQILFCKLHTALYGFWHSVSTGIAHSGHFSLLFQTELPQSCVAVALPNTNNTMGEAAECDRLGCNSLHEN